MTANRFGWIVAWGLALATAAPVSAATLSGAYLAARQAGYQTDFRAAADYYEKALFLDRENPSLIEAAGAALGQLLVGILSKHAGWSAVFAMLVTSCAMASVFLIRLFIKDMRYVIHRRRLRARRPSFDPSTNF